MNSVIYSKALINDLADLTGSRQRVHAIVVNRIRSDTQLTLTQMEEILGQTPLIAITPVPELLYSATRMKTTVIDASPDSMTYQQFNKLAEAMLASEKQKNK